MKGNKTRVNLFLSSRFAPVLCRYTLSTVCHQFSMLLLINKVYDERSSNGK